MAMPFRNKRGARLYIHSVVACDLDSNIWVNDVRPSGLNDQHGPQWLPQGQATTWQRPPPEHGKLATTRRRAT
jgi:hypothetical protein